MIASAAARWSLVQWHAVGAAGARLGKIAITAAPSRAKVETKDVNEVIMGQILNRGAGRGSPARQARSTPVSDRGPGLGHQPARGWPARGRLGASRSWTAPRRSSSPRPGKHEPVAALFAHARRHEDGRRKFIDTMIKDGLWTPSTGEPHGYRRPRTSRASSRSTRAEQDAFAVASQNKAEAARKRPAASKGRDRPVTIKGRKG